MAEYSLGEATVGTSVDMAGLDKGIADAEGVAGSGFAKVGDIMGSALKVGVLGAAAVVVAAVAGIGAAAFDTASQVNQASNDMQAQLGVTAEEADALGQRALKVWGDNWGDSIEDVSASIITVRQQMQGLADEELESVTAKALALRDSFGVEVAESTNAANVLMEKFGLTSDQAFDFLARGYQKGLNNSGDFLESLTEYGVQFAEAGFKADEFFSALESGQQGASSLGTDKIADLVKEGRIRITEMSDDVVDAFKSIGSSSFGADLAAQFGQTGDLMISTAAQADAVNAKLQSLGLPTLNPEDMTRPLTVVDEKTGQTTEQMKTFGDIFMSQILGGINDGSITVAQAQQIAMEGLRGMDNQVRQNSAGVKLFGTQWEDLGSTAALSVDFAATSLNDMAGATDSLNAKYDNWPALWEGIKRSALVAIEPLGQKLLELANNVMPLVTVAFDWMKNDLPPIITTVTTAIDTGVAFITGLFQNDLAPALTENAGFFQTTFTQISEIVTAVAGIIMEVVGVVSQYLTDHGAEIKLVLSGAWTVIQAVITGALAIIQGVVQTVLAVIKGDWQGAWDAISTMVETVLASLGKIVEGQLNMLLGIFGSSISDIKAKWDQFVSDATRIGSNIVQGIIDGVKGAASRLMDTLSSLATDALDAAKEALGISSPSKEFAAVGRFSVLGILAGFEELWPRLMSEVADMGEGLVDQMGKIGQQVQDIIADSFGATATIDRQVAANLDKLKDVLPRYRQFTEGALQEAQRQAEEFLDPAEGAKFFKMRSDQILEYAALQKELSEAATEEDRKRIEQQMLLINKAQQAEIDAFNAQKSDSATQSLWDQINDLMGEIGGGTGLTDAEIAMQSALAGMLDQLNQTTTPNRPLYDPSAPGPIVGTINITQLPGEDGQQLAERTIRIIEQRTGMRLA